MVGGTIVVTPLIALGNYLATDGPYFPAPLVALGFFALPVGFLLLPIQVLLVAYQVITRKALGQFLLLIFVISGLIAGFIWSLVLTSGRIIGVMLIVDSLFAVFQALLVFGCHWIDYNLIQKNFQ
jgi:hypothetical protein